MTLLLHAISTAETPVDAPTGLRARPLVRVEDTGLAAWATEFADPVPRLGQRDLLEQHQIISRLHEQLDACLPARFPTWLAGEDALCADMRRRHSQLTAALEAVRGRCEVAVTVLWTQPDDSVPSPTPAPTRGPTPGTQYLLARQQILAGSDHRRERGRTLADEIERVAGADLVAVRRQVCPSATIALSAALLAPRASATDLIARLPRTRDGVRILVNGPWPPYTFAASGTSEA